MFSCANIELPFLQSILDCKEYNHNVYDLVYVQLNFITIYGRAREPICGM